MKTIKNILALLILLVAFNSCKDVYTEIFTANSPIYMSYKNLRTAIKVTAPRDLGKTGKIYFKDDYIFVNEELKGIHIINNSDPANPQNIGFIEIPGNVDIAIKNNTLFADSYIDLVALDISDITNPKEVKRIKNVFPYTTPKPENKDIRIAKIDKEQGVVIGWEVKKVRQEMEYRYYPVYYGMRENYALDAKASSGISSTTGGGQSFGVGGSMARFGLHNNYLYVVDHSTLFMFDVKNPETPISIGKQNVGWQIETMFIYDKHIFFGTQSGMQVFSLAIPTVPKYVSRFWHVTSCDPVVIANGYAYITLRGGTRCGSNVNRLDVLKLSANYKNNTLVASYPLNSPYGLGIDDQTLFVCDGEEGLKVYSVEDKKHIDDHQIATFSNINTYDVIPFKNHLFMIGKDGFYQYDYTDLQNIHQISFIPVTKKD